MRNRVFALARFRDVYVVQRSYFENGAGDSLKFFSIIEHAFQIQGRGCALVVPRPEADFKVKRDIEIQLRRQDGSIVGSFRAVVPMMSGPGVKNKVAFLVPHGLDCKDVPDKAELWVSD